MASLLYSMGDDAGRVFSLLTFDRDDDKKDFDKVIKAFDEHFVPYRNVIHIRAKFHKRDQKEGEGIEQYVRSLHDLAEHANFPNKEESIRDRIVLGVLDQDLSEKLQLKENLTLKIAITIARQHETVKKELAEQRGFSAVDRLKSYKASETPKREKHWLKEKSRSANKTCSRCGLVHRGTLCPAVGKQCANCGKLSHFARVCRGKKRKGKRTDEIGQTSLALGTESETESSDRESDDDSEDGSVCVHFIGAVNSDVPPWRTQLNIAGKQIDFKIDTGADVNVISRKTWIRIGKPKLSPCTKITLQSPGGRLKTLGHFKTVLNGEHEVNIYVISNDVDSLLSRSTATKLKLVKRIDTTLSTVKCRPVKIKLKKDNSPYSVATARRVPIPLHEKVKTELERMKNEGVIEEITEPTEWVSPMVPVVKPNGDVRICVDLRKLNEAVERERFIIPRIDDVIHKLKGSNVFSKLDAQSGFWQLPLDPSTAKLTTFITPMGRFFFKRLPFGISSAPEIFQRTMLELLEGIDGVICYFDDILCHSKTEAEHEILLEKVKERLKEVGLQLNKQKCEYRKKEITFLGHIVSAKGVRPDPSKISAICQLDEPSDIAGLRRFLGMINYLGRYLPNISTVLRPLNNLLEKNAAWTWGPAQSQAFQKVKTMLTTAPTLAFFDPTKATTVQADASSYGIGGVILQENNGELRPVAFCSRTLTRAEKSYAQIEKELLAAVWACERFDLYLMGMPNFSLHTDHKPLVPLVNTRDLSEAPLRCQRLLMRLMRYKPHAVYQPGKTMVTPDTLSRSPLPSKDDTSVLQEDVSHYVAMVRSAWPVSDTKLNDIREQSQKDINIYYAMEYTLHGWPAYKEDVKLAARDFYAIRGELSVIDGLLVKGDKIVIPHDMRKEILERIHDGHMGITKCRERANQGVWWPQISKDIANRVAKCRDCLERKPQQSREPLLPTQLPERPFEKLAVDLCEMRGKHHLVIIDYYSRWIDISHAIHKVTTSAVVNKLKDTFATHGIPSVVVSDNGPQFASEEFARFSKAWNFSHLTSSPRYPQSNGEAESAVKTAKHILSQSDPQLALLTYRATPLPHLGVSPAELVFRRRVRTTLPVLPKTLSPHIVNDGEVRRRDDVYKQRSKQYFDRHTRPLPELRTGDPVLVKTEDEKAWKRPGEVVTQCAPRSYIIRTADGEIRRNRRHLRPDTARDASLQLGPDEGTGAPICERPTSTMYERPTSTDKARHPATSPEPQQPAQPPAEQEPPDRYVTRSGRHIMKPARFRDD